MAKTIIVIVLSLMETLIDDSNTPNSAFPQL